MPGSCEREMLVLQAHGESTASSLCFWPNSVPYSAANMYPQQGTLDKSFILLGFLLDFYCCCCYFYIKPKSLGNRLKKKKEKTITHNLSNIMILVYFLMCSYLFFFLNKNIWGLPCGLVVKNPPCNAGDMGSIPGQGTKIPCAMSN